MGLLAVISHLSMIFGALRSIEQVVESLIVSDSHVPSGDQVRELIDCTRRLLDSGAISVTGLDGPAIADKLLAFEARFCAQPMPAAIPGAPIELEQVKDDSPQSNHEPSLMDLLASGG